MNRIVNIVVFYLLSAMLLCADESGWRGYFLFEDFSWTETVPGDGGDFVDESGLRYGVGVSFNLVDSGGICLYFNGEGYLGSVDYDGGVQNLVTGESLPYSSKTSYYGMRGGCDLGYMLEVASDIVIIPYVGAGLEVWYRVLDADLFEAEGVYGYTEGWFYGWGRMGFKGVFVVDEATTFYGDVSVDVFPFASEYVNISGDDINLEPDAKIGFDLEVGFSYNQFLISLFWAEKNFDQSNEESGFVQPKSEERRIGVKAGIEF